MRGGASIGVRRGRGGPTPLTLHRLLLWRCRRREQVRSLRPAAWFVEVAPACRQLLLHQPGHQQGCVEVKTTNGWDRTPFHISRNEAAVAEAQRDSWHLFRVWDFARAPKAFVLRPPLDAHVLLTPTSFLASLR